MLVANVKVALEKAHGDDVAAQRRGRLGHDRDVVVGTATRQPLHLDVLTVSCYNDLVGAVIAVSPTRPKARPDLPLVFVVVAVVVE